MAKSKGKPNFNQIAKNIVDFSTRDKKKDAPKKKVTSTPLPKKNKK